MDMDMDNEYDQEAPQVSFTQSEQDADNSNREYADLKQLIAQVGRELDPEPDLQNLSAAEMAVTERERERHKMQDDLKAELQRLISLQQAAAASARRPPTVPSLEQHNEAVQALEQQQMSTGKQVNEEQARVAKREIEMGDWKGRREEIRAISVGESEEEGYNARALRLNILDGCGFRLLPHESGDKVIIRNDAKTDINTITLDKSRSKVYWANLMWSLAGE